MLYRKPIHGLIFLFQYLPEDWEVDKESDTDDVWFANQAGSMMLSRRRARH